MIPYEEFIALDMEFEKLLSELPPFFQVDDEHSTSYLPAKGYEERQNKKAKCQNDADETLYISAMKSGGGVEASQIATQRFMIRMTTPYTTLQIPSAIPCQGFHRPKIPLLP